MNIYFMQELQKHPHPVCALRFAPDSQSLLTSDGDQLAFWERTPNRLIHVRTMDLPAYQIAFSPGGDRFACVGFSVSTNHHIPPLPVVHLCDIFGQESFQLPLTIPPTALVFDPESQFLLISDRQAGIQVWDVREHGNTVHFQLVPSYAVGGKYQPLLRISADGSLLAFATKRSQGVAHLSTIRRSPQEVPAWSLVSIGILGKPVVDVVTCAFSPDQRFFAAVYGPEIDLYDPLSLNHRAHLFLPDDASQRTPTDRIFCLAFSPDGLFLAGATIHGIVHIWDLLTFQVTATCAAHTDVSLEDNMESVIGDIDWSSDGTLIATSSMGKRRNHQPYEQSKTREKDYSVRLWEVKR